MVKLSSEEVKLLIGKSYRCRENILKMMRYGEGHIGGAFSSIDIMTVLYNKILRHNPKNSKWPDRDRFILSAGHKCLALYTVLADQGYFDEGVLWTYNTLDTKVPMHPDEKALPGIEFPTGSLGHGLAVANAVALTARLDKKDYRVFVMLGDGECAEGSVWEAVLASAHYRIDNITVIVDRNGLQVNGRTVDVMSTHPFEDKFKAFGWEVVTIDGHDFNQIYSALSSVPFSEKKPSCIIADTIKCKGLSFAEDKFQYHHWHCELSQVDEAINLVDSTRQSELEKA
ncbi:MAG: transketolase [Actinobacteria bacterium]|nr:transketolase [Actinomycetota bacterium]MBM3712909.1 transketolase [Actinomycetota bacterium]